MLGCQPDKHGINKDTEERQLRAYVLPDHSVINDADDDITVTSTKPITVFIWIKNTGITPAYKVVNISGAALLPFPSRINMQASNTPQTTVKSSSSSFLPAGAPERSDSVYVIGAEYPLSTQQKEGLKDGSTAIYFFGEITYYDTFGILRCTRYEYYVGGNYGIKGSDMVSAPEGQEADTDCHPPTATATFFVLPPVPHYQFQ